MVHIRLPTYLPRCYFEQSGLIYNSLEVQMLYNCIYDSV